MVITCNLLDVLPLSPRKRDLHHNVSLSCVFALNHAVKELECARCVRNLVQWGELLCVFFCLQLLHLEDLAEFRATVSK
jgi:hypothetical protein